MGCTIPSSILETFLTEFVDELTITKLTDKKYISLIEKNNSFQYAPQNIQDLFYAKSTYRDEHDKYSAMNINQNQKFHYLYVSLLFLSQFNRTNFSSNYFLTIEKLKNKHYEMFGRNLDDFMKPSHEVLHNVLFHYCKLISQDVLEVCQNSSKGKLNQEQVNFLRNCYQDNNIEHFVNDLIRNSHDNFNHDDFFSKNLTNLKHNNVRERLREFYAKNIDTIKFPPTPKKTLSLLPNPIAPVVPVVPPVQEIERRPTKIFSLNNNKEIENQIVHPYTPTPVVDDKNHLVSAPRPPKELNFNYDYAFRSTIYEIDDVLKKGKQSASHNNINHVLDQLDHNAIPKTNISNERPLVNPTLERRASLKPLDFEKFRRNSLYLHNEKRRFHNAADLTEDRELTDFAQSWANALAEVDNLSHSSCLWGGRLVGENIARAGGILDDGAELIIDKWYSEKNNYNFINPGSQAQTKNFTQLVWKNSRLVGFGIAFSKTGKTYVVVNYYPAGNEPTSFAANVSA